MKIEIIGTLTKVLPSEFYERKGDGSKAENFQIIVTRKRKNENEELEDVHYAVKVFVNGQSKSPSVLEKYLDEKVKVVGYLKSNQDKNGKPKWYNDVTFGSIEYYVPPASDDEKEETRRQERSHKVVSNPNGGTTFPIQEQVNFEPQSNEFEPDTDDLPF